MKKSPLLIISVLLVSFLLVSCSAPASGALTADQVLKKMVESNKNLKSGRITNDMEMSVAGINFTISSSGVFENPGKLYMTVNMMDSTFQLLILSSTEIYTRQGESGIWTRSTTEAEAQSGSLYDFTKNPQLLKFAKNVRLLEEKAIQECNAACYHLGFELDAAKLFMASGTSSSLSPDLTFLSPAKVELWIDKTDFFTRRQEATFSVNVEGEEDVAMKVVVTQADINQPVTIPSP